MLNVLVLKNPFIFTDDARRRISSFREQRFPDICKTALGQKNKHFGVFTKTCWGGGGGGVDEVKKGLFQKYKHSQGGTLNNENKNCH